MTEPIENHRPGGDEPSLLDGDEPGLGWAPPGREAASDPPTPPRPASTGAVPTRITLPPDLRPISPPGSAGTTEPGAEPAWVPPSAPASPASPGRPGGPPGVPPGHSWAGSPDPRWSGGPPAGGVGAHPGAGPGRPGGPAGPVAGPGQAWPAPYGAARPTQGMPGPGPRAGRGWPGAQGAQGIQGAQGPGGWGPGGWGTPPPGATRTRTPSGLFPSGRPRPIYREPFPISRSGVAAGAGSAALWMLLFGVLASTARAYAWWTIGAGLVAWFTALALARFGDRGVAVGIAIGSAVGVGIAGIVVFVRALGGHWLLW